jgi:predicted molibdopterin-dependent oxidoreductase YjgC
VFGAGGGTSSYREIEGTDLVILWGSNARETHPIFFHHLLKGIRNGARLIVVDPRRTSSARWADLWLGLEVGSDIALANAIGHEIISAGLANTDFVRNATSGYDDYLRCVEAYPPERAESITGIPAGVIREVARGYAQARRAQVCWTLGITEHHNAVDNVLALINLALLTGHVGREGSGLNPLRGQNNVQGGGDMGAIPNRLPGFQDVEDDAIRARFEAAWDCVIPPRRGMHLSQMFDAMEEGKLSSLFIVGENPAQSEADQKRALRLLKGLRHIVVQDIYLTRTAELADVVLPASASWSESEGTVTNSERRVQRSRRALEPPPGARDDLEILAELARRLGREWAYGSAEAVWDEVRALSPMHGGMTYSRLEELGGIQWPCPSDDHPGTPTLHTRLWSWPLDGPPAPFSAVEHEPPVDELSKRFPIRLTTGRRLDSFNTGVQSGRFPSPLRQGETIDLHPLDAAGLGVAEGEIVRVVSRRGALEAPVRLDRGLRPGLAFMTLHFPDEVPTNRLTIDTYDPKSGTAEFKATAIRVERIGAGAPA